VRVFLVATAVLAASFAVIVASGPRDGGGSTTLFKGTSKTVAATPLRVRSLPVLPAQGLALARGADVELRAIAGRRLAVLQRMQLVGGAGGPIVMAPRSEGAPWRLDVRRHRLVEVRTTTILSLNGNTTVILAGSKGVPSDCFPVMTVRATAFARCMHGSGRLVAVRAGRATTVVDGGKGALFWLELSPDRHWLAVTVNRFRNGKTCRAAEVFAVDTQTLDTRDFGTATPLGFLPSSELVLFEPSCKPGQGQVEAVDGDVRRVVARHVDGAALWGDAGTHKSA
jgi:hypothetical protein